jgi:DNA-binding LacI/PurR family transcriptional regulator
MAKVTASDVANLAGVSRSAVSRVFTPGASASRDTAARVRKAAMELGYHHIGSRRRTAEQACIGLVVSNVENPFYSQATKSLSIALQEKGYDTLLLVEMPTVGTADAIVARCLDHGVDGLLVSSAATVSELADQCEKVGIPTVFFNRRPNDNLSNCVTSDNYSGGRKVGEYLISSGHKKIAQLAGWAFASTQRDREAGLMAALMSKGMTLHSKETGNFDYHEAQEATRRLFSGPDRPDAVFVANDHMAFACMDVLRYELGLSIPQDVSVVGFDDVPQASWPSYDLTTVSQPIGQMCSQAIGMLVNQVEVKHTRSERIAVDGNLIIRGSSRPIR